MRFNRNVRRFSQPLSIITCTDKLRQNDPGFVELSLERKGDDFDIDDFVYSLKCNQTVKHVCFSGTFIRELEDEQWDSILESIGHLQTLEELQIWCSTIPVTTFAHTLRNASRLHKVYFFRVKLSGTQAEFDDLANTIRVHPALRDFRIGGFELNDEQQDLTMDSIIEALAYCPTLRSVNLQLTGVRDVAPFSGTSLAKLLCSPYITSLYLSRLGLQQEHYGVIALGILSSNNLKTMDLYGNSVENDHVIMLCKALEHNKSLESLVLPCPNNNELRVDTCEAISRALQKNTTLQTLNLPRSTLDDAGLVHLVEGLSVNNTLKKIEVGVKKDLGDEGMDALTDMLESNYELERLVLSSAAKSVKDKVEYYMRLNEVGRGSLLRDGKASREQWVEMLISVKDDLDCLFYFTSMNPAICQFAHPSRAEVIITEEFRPARRHTINNFNACRDESATRIYSKPRRASAF